MPDSFGHGGADSGAARPRSRRRLRAAFAADVAGFSRIVSADETLALGGLTEIRAVAREELAVHDGRPFGMPGDGIFALFESALDAVACALRVQARLHATAEAGEMRLRIGIHMGEVLFDSDLPFGQTLAIAARLEALAPPGGVLVSGPVRDAVAHRVDAGFRSLGAPELKNIPLRLEVLEVVTRHDRHDVGRMAALDQTMGMPRLGSILAEAATPPASPPAAVTPAPERPPMRVAEFERLLTRHVGPAASILVARALASGRSLSDVAEGAALGIPTEGERASFRGEVARLLGPDRSRCSAGRRRVDRRDRVRRAARGRRVVMSGWAVSEVESRPFVDSRNGGTPIAKKRSATRDADRRRDLPSIHGFRRFGKPGPWEVAPGRAACRDHGRSRHLARRTT